MPACPGGAAAFSGSTPTCRKSLCFLCPNPYPFPTGFSKNTRVYAPGFGTIAAKMPRINPDPTKNARGKFCGRSEKRSGFIRWALGISPGIYPAPARDIAWDLSGGRSGNCLGFFWWWLRRSPSIFGIALGVSEHVPRHFPFKIPGDLDIRSKAMERHVQGRQLDPHGHHACYISC